MFRWRLANHAADAKKSEESRNDQYESAGHKIKSRAAGIEHETASCGADRDGPLDRGDHQTTADLRFLRQIARQSGRAHEP